MALRPFVFLPSGVGAKEFAKGTLDRKGSDDGGSKVVLFCGGGGELRNGLAAEGLSPANVGESRLRSAHYDLAKDSRHSAADA